MVWLINFRSPIDLWQHEPTFFLGQLVFTCCAALTLVHALRHGGRYKWLWLTTVAHGLNTECLSYWLPDIDNFWHAQGFATLFGFREPFYILLLYPTFIYPACVAVSRLRLPEHVEPFATALAVVIVDVPYDIMGIKLLWWTWHDTDPNIFERHYWVPWTSYFFHMTFACAFTFIYNHTRRRFVGLSGLYADDDIERMPFAQRRHALNWRGELKALLVTALFSMPCGIMQFTVGYHWPHDILHVPSSCCVGILAGLYLTITLYGLQRRTPLHVRDDGERELRRGYTRRGKGRWHYDEVVMAVLLHYGFYVLLVLFASPSRTVARGLHQTIGDCAPDVTTERPTGQHGMPHIRRSQPLIFLGQVGYPYSLIPFLGPYIGNVVVSKDPTLCPTSFGEDYFDFACVPDKDMMPQPGDSWYDVCGTPYENWHEYVFVVTGVCVLATCFYLHALHYPRTVLEILTAGHFPRYYKSYAPARRRGTEGMLRLRAPGKGNDGEGEGEGNGEGGVGGRTGDGGGGAGASPELELELEPEKPLPAGWVWVSRQDFALDGAGPAYGERGGLFGMSGAGSSRERIRTAKNHVFALDRIARFKRDMQQQQQQEEEEVEEEVEEEEEEEEEEHLVTRGRRSGSSGSSSSSSSQVRRRRSQRLKSQGTGLGGGRRALAE